MPTIADVLADAKIRIGASRSNTPRLDAELLYRHVSGLDRTGLFLALRDEAGDEQTSLFHELVASRIAGQPIAYLIGHREFMGLRFTVTPDVLIPRPETELLVEWALAQLNARSENLTKVVDVGAGSGAIAVSIAALGAPHASVVAVEPSRAAREVIERNAAALLDDEQRSRFAIADDHLLSNHPGPFGMVLANLPYLTPEQLASNPDLAAEPRMALDGGSDGLVAIRQLISQLPKRLRDTCVLGLEIDPSQSGTVATLLRETIPDIDISIIKDLAGFDRHVVATRNLKASP